MPPARKRKHHAEAHGRRVRVELDRSTDEEGPRSTVAFIDDATGEHLLEGRLPPTFKLTIAAAANLVAGNAR